MKYTTRIFTAVAALLALFAAQSCSTDADITAEPQAMYVVYGVLNPTDSVQYVRIERGFLVDGNALEVAADSDLSVRGLNVVIEYKDIINNKTYSSVGTEVQIQKDSGIFKKDGYVYKFSIPLKINGADNPKRLKGGYPVKLTITRPGDEDFKITSQTTVPKDINITAPSKGSSGTQWARELTPLHQTVKIEYTRAIGAGAGSYAFDMRMGIAYTRNGIPDTLTWRYGDLQTRSVCSEDGKTAMCFSAADGTIARSFKTQLDRYSGQDLRIDDRFTQQPSEANLSKACWLDVVAVDTFFARYLIVNDPDLVDLNQVKPEYTNISGSDNGELILTYGVFGAINSQRRYFGLTQCVKYLFDFRNLNGTPTPQPTDACFLP